MKQAKHNQERKKINQRHTKLKLFNKKILALIAVICIVLFFIKHTQKTKIDKTSLSPEIARSMEYTVVADTDKNVSDNSGNNIEAVKFDSYFIKDTDGDGVAETYLRGSCNEIGKFANLYIDFRVQNSGYVKDGKITINSKNFKFRTAILKDDDIAKDYISNDTNEILLNRLNNGMQKTIIGLIQADVGWNNVPNLSSSENSITFSGTYVADDNTETPFSKTVPLTVDWYSGLDCNIQRSSNVTIDSMDSLVNEDSITLSFDVTTYETNGKLPMKEANISGTMPDFNGYKPTSVVISGANVTYTYDPETGNFTAKKEAVQGENGIITQNAYSRSSSNTRYTDFKVTAVYPKEAYEQMGEGVQSIELSIPIEAVNKGFNNPNDEFDNPYISNTAKDVVNVVIKVRQENPAIKYNPSFGLTIGDYVSSPYYSYVIKKTKPLNIYNGIKEKETDDTYVVMWRAYTGTNGQMSKILMYETVDNNAIKNDEFQTTENNYISMNELTTNTGIYFSGADSSLGKDGYIRVYNAESNTLIKEFNSSNWNQYSKNSPYKYDSAIKHIKIETSSINEGYYFYAYSVKELDDEYITENFTKEEFDNFKYIRTNLYGEAVYEKEDGSTGTYKETLTNKALYIAPTAIANISLGDSYISAKETRENEIITITTDTTSYNTEKWKNGTFLVQIPKEIILAEVNNITTTNENVKISAYDVYEENGNYYIKILTENDNPESFSIKIDCNLTPDPALPKTTVAFKLYATNEAVSQYYYNAEDIYDVDGDLNKNELVNYRTTSLTIETGTGLSTSPRLTNYDRHGSITVAPRVAKADNQQRTAKIELSATNNYTTGVQDIKIMGVLPFKGNKFIMGGKDMGSEYTTYLQDAIKPKTTNLEGKYIVYYSESEDPMQDVTADNTGWHMKDGKWKTIDEIEDLSKIRSYIIVIDEDYVLGSKQIVEFEYNIQIPEGVEYNKVTYAEHAINFGLQTEEGRYYTSTAANKVGLMIAKQYELEIIKSQKDKEKLLPGVTFTLTEDGKETSTIKTTDANGKIVFDGLYTERYYTLKEQKTSADYVLNSEEIRFYTYITVDDDGTEHIHLLKDKDDQNSLLQNTYGCIKEASVLAPNNANKADYKVQLKIENEPKAKLAITKTDRATGEKLKNAKFKITGEGKDETYTTNNEGKINIDGLYLNKEYTLEELKLKDYYIPSEKIKFKIVNESGTFKLKQYTDNGTTKNLNDYTQNDGISKIEINDEIPTLNLDLENDKIPSYSFKLTKYAKGEKDAEGQDKKLENAQYQIFGEGISDKGKIYQTDENGVLTINNLYEYVDGKYITGEYTIKEIYAPEGYSANTTELKFKAYRENGVLKVDIISGEDVIRTINATEDAGGESKQDLNILNPEDAHPVIEIGVEDSQIFSMFKYTEDETPGVQTPIKGTKFKITDLDGNYVTGTDGKIVGEWIDTTPEQAPLPAVELSSTGTYKWTKRDDGTWESTGNNKVPNSTSVLSSNEFELIQPAKLKFEWAVSSESISYDYVYYEIKKIGTSTVIGGAKDGFKIGGNGGVKEYDKLSFAEVEKELEAGTYQIVFTYRKDGSGDTGLDAGFIRNFRLEPNIQPSGYAVVTTDENGRFTANLPEGMYKAVEVSTDDKYVLPENEADRTYYFGVGASRAASWDWKNSVQGKGWNYINGISKTKDGGIVGVGSFSEYSNVLVSGATDGVDVDKDNNIDKVSQGNNDGIITCYDNNGDVLWAKSFGGDDDDVLHKVIQTKDGGYMAVGYTASAIVQYDGVEKENISKNYISDGSTVTGDLAMKDAIMLKLDSNGNYEWGVRFGGTSDDEIKSVIETGTGNYAVVGSIGNNGFIASYSALGVEQWKTTIGANYKPEDVIEYSSGLATAVNSGSNAYVYRYNLSTGEKINTSVSFGSNYKITSIDKDGKGNILAGVNYGNVCDARIYKFAENATSAGTPIFTLKGEGTASSSGGNLSDYVSSVKATSDGGILFGGWYYSTQGLDVDGDGSLEGKFDFPALEGDYTSDGYVIKLESSGKVIYSSRLYGNGYEGVTSVAETKNGALASGGYFNGSTLTATNYEQETEDGSEENPSKTVKLFDGKGNSEGFVISEGASGAAIAEALSLKVENKIKTFKVTTQVIKNNGELGGTITGEEGIINGTEYSKDAIRYVELVKYGENSINEIVVTPKTINGTTEETTADTNYVIDYITINGEAYTNYTVNPDTGAVTIPVFENVKNDIHVIVQFSNTKSNIEVNHYLWKGNVDASTTKVADSKTETGDVGAEYKTLPETEIEYEIITNGEFYGVDNVPEGKNAEDLYIPDNHNGTFKSSQTEVINYYYKEKTYTLTVHHYIEGTNEKVPLKNGADGETVDDEFTDNLRKGSNYETTNANDTKIDYTIYELTQTPENATGVIEGDTEVIYYYKIKEVGLDITKVAEENHEQTIKGTQFALYKWIGSGTATNDLIDKNNVDTTKWRLAGTYTSSSNGIIKLENLPITEEYRLIEIKASEGRLIADGQWKIEFMYGNYDESDTSIITINDTPLKITAIGNPPAFVIEEGKLLIPNTEGFDFPLSGAFGKIKYYKVGITIIAIGLGILVLRKRKLISRRSTGIQSISRRGASRCSTGRRNNGRFNIAKRNRRSKIELREEKIKNYMEGNRKKPKS